MNKLVRNLIISIAVLGALIGAYFWASGWEAPQEEPAPDTSVALLSIKKDDITEISVSNALDNYTFVKAESGWVVKDREHIKLQQPRVDSLGYDFVSVSASQLVKENADDLDTFGLSAPAASVVVRTADSTYAFELGDKALGSLYYFKTTDSNNVYTVYSSKADSMNRELMYFRDTVVETISAENITGLALVKPDGERIAVKLRDGGGDPESMGLNAWLLTEPREMGASDDRMGEFLEALSKLTISKLYADHAENPAALGLDKPTLLTISGIKLNGEQAEDASLTLKIGAATEGECYVMVNEESAVYLVDESALTFKDTNWFDIITKFVELVNIDTVDTIEASAGDVKHILRVEKIDEETSKYFIDGKEANEKGFKSVYQSIIGLTVDEVAQPVAARTQPYATVLYNMKDGTQTLIELVEYNSRNFAVFRNGECSFVILKKKVDQMLEHIANFANDPGAEAITQ